LDIASDQMVLHIPMSDLTVILQGSYSNFCWRILNSLDKNQKLIWETVQRELKLAWL
jgi:hypothetical protein